MKKCHCASVPFDQIVKLAINSNCSYERIAKDLDAGETCTACREDMKTYCESAGVCAERNRSSANTFDKLSASTQLQLQEAL